MTFKKKISAAFLFITSCTLFFSCVFVPQYDYAQYDQKKAIEHINNLKEDTLVVVIPTQFNQMSLLRSLLEKNPNKKEQTTKKINKLQLEIDRERVAIFNAFKEKFSFCPVIYIKEELVSDYEEGKEGYYFIDINGEVDKTIQYNNRNPIKLIQQFDYEWHIRINNKILPNPFPNYYRYRNGLVYLLGLESIEQVSKNVADIFSKRFHWYHANPTKKLAY